MSVTVATGDPRTPAVAALIGESHALMHSLFPPEDNFHYSLDELTAPHITFFVACRGADILGTAALADMGTYGEVKQMYVVERARGTGTGGLLLARLEAEARAKRLPILMLETGDLLVAAHRLYARKGFSARGPFGNYPAANSSVFMEKRLG